MLEEAAVEGFIDLALTEGGMAEGAVPDAARLGAMLVYV